MAKTTVRVPSADASVRLRIDAPSDGTQQQALLSIEQPGHDGLLHLARRGDQLIVARRVGGEWGAVRAIGAVAPGTEASALLTLKVGEARLVSGQEETVWPMAQTAEYQWQVFRGVRPTPLASRPLETLRALIRKAVHPAGLRCKLFEDLIYDLGANNGDDADFYLRKGFRVVAVEANPMLCETLAVRFEDEVVEGRLMILNVGLAPDEGQMTFYVNLDHDEWSSFDRDVASRGHAVKEVVVPTVTLASLYRAFGVPYYLKIDIEGYDHVAVVAAAEHSVRPRYVSFENATSTLMEVLAAAGYDRFQLVNQACVPQMRCPSPAREGDSVDAVFPFGSTGPFGADLPDEWQDADRMRATLARHALDLAERPDSVSGQWFDLHASRPMA